MEYKVYFTKEARCSVSLLNTFFCTSGVSPSTGTTAPVRFISICSGSPPLFLMSEPSPLTVSTYLSTASSCLVFFFFLVFFFGGCFSISACTSLYPLQECLPCGQHYGEAVDGTRLISEVSYHKADEELS